MQPLRWDDWPSAARGIFQGFRSPAGETMVLDKNLFVEAILPASVIRSLSDAEMDEYRRPYTTPGESRRPTLTWPRQIPIDGDPPDVVDIVTDYAQWLTTCDVPKLLVVAEPGAILAADNSSSAARGPTSPRSPCPATTSCKRTAPTRLVRPSHRGSPVTDDIARRRRRSSRRRLDDPPLSEPEERRREMSPWGADGVDAGQAMETARDGAGQLFWLPATADGTVSGEERVGSSIAVACRLPRCSARRTKWAARLPGSTAGCPTASESRSIIPIPWRWSRKTLPSCRSPCRSTIPSCSGATGSSLATRRATSAMAGATGSRSSAHGPGARSVCCGTPPTIGSADCSAMSA